MSRALFLMSLLLLQAMGFATHTWSQAHWYQVGLDTEPRRCQLNSLQDCRSSRSCPDYWMSLEGNRFYPVAGVTITTTMMLMASHVMLRRWRSQGTQGKGTSCLFRYKKRQLPASDLTLLRRVLHMLDAILLHIESHLQRLASQQQVQIKGTPTQCG